MKERGENPPRSIQLIIPHKIRMIPFERIEEQSFICFGDMQVGKAAFVRQVQLKRGKPSISRKSLNWEGNKWGRKFYLGGCGTHGETRQFSVHFHVHRLVGLNPNDQFVTRDIFENAGRDVIKLDSNFHLLLVQCCTLTTENARKRAVPRAGCTLAGLEDKRDTIPAFIFDGEGDGGEGRTSTIFGNGAVIQITWFVAICDVLPDDNILCLDRRNRTQDTHLPINTSITHQNNQITQKKGSNVEEREGLDTFSSLISSAEKEIGLSIATNVKTCNK